MPVGFLVAALSVDIIIYIYIYVYKFRDTRRLTYFIYPLGYWYSEFKHSLFPHRSLTIFTSSRYLILFPLLSACITDQITNKPLTPE